MCSGAFLTLIAELDRSLLDEPTRRAVRRLIYKVGAIHNLAAIGQVEKIEHARFLLDQNVSVPTVRDRVAARFSISGRQAYRVIHEALQLRHDRQLNVTQFRFNSTHAEGESDAANLRSNHG